MRRFSSRCYYLLIFRETEGGRQRERDGQICVWVEDRGRASVHVYVCVCVQMLCLIPYCGLPQWPLFSSKTKWNRWGAGTSRGWPHSSLVAKLKLASSLVALHQQFPRCDPAPGDRTSKCRQKREKKIDRTPQWRDFAPALLNRAREAHSLPFNMEAMDARACQPIFDLFTASGLSSIVFT